MQAKMDKTSKPKAPEQLRRETLRKVASLPAEKRQRLQQLLAKERGLYLPPKG